LSISVDLKIKINGDDDWDVGNFNSFRKRISRFQRPIDVLNDSSF
jgi:hypothetical protein